jgi:hypothetical protein
MEIRLPNPAKVALGRLAIREFRDPAAQAAVIIVEHLRDLGLLSEDSQKPSEDQVQLAPTGEAERAEAEKTSSRPMRVGPAREGRHGHASPIREGL